MVHLYHLFVAATSFLAIVPSAFAIPTIEKREVHPVQSLFERIQTFHEVTTSVPAPWDANQYFVGRIVPKRCGIYSQSLS